MSDKFRKLANERRDLEPRAAIPQLDPEAVKPQSAEAVPQTQPTADRPLMDVGNQVATPSGGEAALTERPIFLTPVDTSERRASQGFLMYPSRHRQLKDIAYIEGRNPWEVLDDALEEYAVRHYGKGHKRR
jgi:hypothetical protein